MAATIVVAGLAALGAASFAQPDDPLGSTRTALEKWVETRRIMSEERREWALGREILGDRIEAIRGEIAKLGTDEAKAREDITKLDLDRDELVAQNERLKEASAKLGEIIAALEARTLTLLVRLPEPLRDRVRLLSQEIPTEGETSKLSLSQRYQNVIGVLNEVNRFHKEITVTTERRGLGDGTTAEVTTIYVGIAQGFYVGRQGTVAGIGTGTAEGWTWRTANDIAPEVARLVAIVRNEDVAAFVPMPVRVED